MKLTQRFELFVKTMQGFESIDELLRGVQLDGKKRADYMLGERHIIVEQKALVVDPIDRPQKFVDRLMQEGRLVAYGTTSTRSIFDRLPEGEELERKMLLGITKGVEDAIANADKQTRDTRKIFGIPNATGLVVVLNESAPTLYPDLVRYGLDHVFKKKAPDGRLRYPHNDGVLVISEAHTVTASGRGMPCFAGGVPNGRAGDVVSAFADELISAWASFNDLPLVRYASFEDTHQRADTKRS